MKRTSVLLCLVALYAISAVLCQNDCDIRTRVADIKSHRTPVRAVNLGSWLNLEGWMVSDLWSRYNCDQNSVQGQWMFERCVGASRIQQVLEQHWSTFITENDFQKMASNGINAVRVPLGWWTIYDTYGGAEKAPLNYFITPKNYTVGGLKYIDAMFQWGQKYSIAILLDMHAAPGCQNTEQDCSPSVVNNGQAAQYWDIYESNQGETVDSIGLYAQRYANQPALLGFCLLNEPMTQIPPLQAYYKNAYTRIRSFVNNDPVIVINPLIHPFQSGTEPDWVNFMNPSDGYVNVWVDEHYYEAFGDYFNDMTNEQKIAYAKNDRAAQIKQYNQVNPKPMVILEWATTGVDGNNGYPRAFTQAQIGSYSLAKAGWGFWAWPNGSPGNTWSFQSALSGGWVSPTQLSQRCYGFESNQTVV